MVVRGLVAFLVGMLAGLSASLLINPLMNEYWSTAGPSYALRATRALMTGAAALAAGALTAAIAGRTARPVGFAVAAIFAAWGLVVLAIDGRHLTPVVVTFTLPPCFALGVEVMARRPRVR